MPLKSYLNKTCFIKYATNAVEMHPLTHKGTNKSKRKEEREREKKNMDNIKKMKSSPP